MSHATIAVDYNSKWDVNKPAPRKYLGFGLQHYRYGDMGNSPLTASFTSFSGAYHTLLDKRGRHYFGAGAQATFASGKLDRSKGLNQYVYEKEISGGGFRYRAGDSDTPYASHSYLDYKLRCYWYNGWVREVDLDADVTDFIYDLKQNDIFNAGLCTILGRKIFRWLNDMAVTETEQLDKTLAKVTETYKKVAIFSNGEAVYEKIDIL